MRDDVARALAARALEVAQKTKSQQGPKGEKGDPGQIIVQPNKGDKGDTGPMGPQGIPGKSITGPKGDKGDKGDPGQKGDKGDKGESGAKGDTGERGERGFQGLRGSNGSKGDIGPMPKHEKKGLMIRFEKEPGTWGEWIVMPTGGGGGGRDDKLTDRQAELVALAEFYKTRGSNTNKYIKSDGTNLTWDTLDAGDITGFGTIATQNANAVAITGGTATLTSVTTPVVQATNSAGLALRNSGGTTQISMGAGGGDNVTVAVSTNLNGANAQIDISPTGTGHVHIKPTGVNSVEIAPTFVGEMDNITIGSITPKAGTFTTITGQTGVLRGTGQNLIIFSEQFENSTFTSNVSITANTTVAPNGTTTADTITSTINGGSNTCVVDRLATPIVQNTTYAFSVYLKQGTSPTTAVNLWFSGGTYVEAYSLVTWSATPTLTVSSGTGIITSVGDGWYRIAITQNSGNNTGANCRVYVRSSGTSNVIGDSVIAWGRQLELSTTTGAYVQTVASAVYGTPTLSFSGVSTIGLESNGALFVQPAGTGALQAQATTSTTAGGNARGANAVDWQTSRNGAAQVASGSFTTLSGGTQNTATGFSTVVAGGFNNFATASGFIGGGSNNQNNGTYGAVVTGSANASNGVYNFIGGGFTNSGTANAAVTTQSATMNGTTAVTLSGSNANIKVGQYISGTSIGGDTYVAAISGTSLTLSKVATGSSTSTLSFFTPHGVVVGGGNNQATGSYSFIGGGGDAGTAANRNVASGDWSFVGGGTANQATGIGSVIAGGGTFGSAAGNTAAGVASFIGAGFGNSAPDLSSSVLGSRNTASGDYATCLGGRRGTTRSIQGNTVFAACSNPIADASGTSQTGLLVLATQTTDATATALRSNISAAGTTNQVILPNNSAYFFRGEVISGVTGGGDTKGWTIEGVIKRGANAASTALVGTPTVTSSFADAGASTWTIAVTADTTNGGLRVTFTGQASTTIRTVCSIRTCEMTF